MRGSTNAPYACSRTRWVAALAAGIVSSNRVVVSRSSPYREVMAASRLPRYWVAGPQPESEHCARRLASSYKSSGSDSHWLVMLTHALGHADDQRR